MTIGFVRTLAALCFIIFFVQSAQCEVTRYRKGNPRDVNPKLHGPAFHLQGGGTDVDAAFQWMFDQVRGCTDCSTKLDVVVLRASGEDGYNDYLLAMKGVDSVETLIIKSPKDSLRQDVVETIKNAEVIFFAGGDQCNYVRNFKGTPVQSAVDSVYKRGGGISGTSAGQAIQGDYSYDACTGSTRSFEALANPYHESITFTYDFFHWKNMQNTITDQHLVERNRMGRTLAFLARQIRDGKTGSVLGIAVNRETSVVVDGTGLAKILGKGPAYFILADHRPEVCEPNQPLTYSNFKIWKADASSTFDLKHRPNQGYYLRSVKNGVINADPYAVVPCPSAELHTKFTAFKEPVELERELKTTMRTCPYNFEPYQYVIGTNNPDFIKAAAADLRRFLNYAMGADRLRYFSTLWTLEFKITRETEYEELRKQISEDVKSLAGDKDFKDLQSLRVLKQGYELLQDETAAKKVEEEIQRLNHK